MADTKIKNFYDLDAWRKGHELAVTVYIVTKAFPKEEAYGVTSQIRRASSSVGANIAEGFARYHFKDKVRFYHQARGSAAEVQNFLLLSRELNYITEEICASILRHTDETMQLINGLIRSIEKQK